MNVYLGLALLCILVFSNVEVGGASRKGSRPSTSGGHRDGWRTQEADSGDDTVDVGLGSCKAQGRKSRTLKNRIIRTKDSIDNGACFADAIAVSSMDQCSDRCCSYSGDDCDSNCDTSIFVHESDDEVNCFLFMCGDNDDCRFSYHSGYTTTQHSYHQTRIEEKPLAFTTTQKTTTVSYQTTSTYPQPTSSKYFLTTAVLELPTTKIQGTKTTEQNGKEEKSDDSSQGCRHFEFKCGSGECYRFSYVCDGIIDCRDNSDETGCDYATTVNNLITTRPLEIGVHSTRQDAPLTERTSTAGSLIPKTGSENSYDDEYDYENVASYDEQNVISENTGEVRTTEAADEAEESTTTVLATTVTKAISNSSLSSVFLTNIPGNVTEIPKKTLSNTSNKSIHKSLYKKKSKLPDKSLTSAILPLAFGLLITVLLLLLVGCRLRQVNRRLRYGRLKTNVAEADYLINGMYL